MMFVLDSESDIPVIDLDVDELEVLKRYESVYCAFVGEWIDS
jgi:hypothetical protein